MSIDWSKAPEGATHYDPVDENFLREVDEALLLYLNGTGWRVAQYTPYGFSVAECNRPLLMRPAWNGIGNPAAGVKCEIHVIGMPLQQWHERTVLFLGRDHLCYADSDGNEWCAPLSELQFRPIRTTEQIAADERKAQILEMIDVFGLDTSIWGLDTVREICGHLWEAGYRKQPTP
ncbi:hypothetical protein QN386_17845 [Pseudomonas sp. CCI3.2]|uniref:hypothetical protein n=1 Tax=unclassified Pseudomonas TaxID=196821 RepID=UPI002B236C28|nr:MULTISPECIES: hypothetical protein [unclassified Pseudomonas]MEB0078055.1 hypothetical protein [Pseudomonas sp. MH10out]MEB0103172.1 hypothetical protein [Pseudomonas sp. CCI3.2]